MSYWNYRAIRKSHEESDTDTYQIHEVYYDKDGNIEGWTESPVKPLGETPDELREDIRFFIKAFQKPILEEQIKDGKLVGKEMGYMSKDIIKQKIEDLLAK